MFKKKSFSETSDAAALEDSNHAYQDLRQNEQFVRLHNEVMEGLNNLALQQPDPVSRVLAGFLEIANFMLKNTCGLGSNFKLAECQITTLGREDIKRYYALVLTILGIHFGAAMPDRKELIWQSVLSLSSHPDLCREFALELDGCKDHQDGSYSPVRAGRKLWERAAALLRIENPEKNTTARIYYQTAPGQDLIFITEKVLAEGWFTKK